MQEHSTALRDVGATSSGTKHRTGLDVSSSVRYLGALSILWRACNLRLLRQRKARRDIGRRHTRRLLRRALLKLGGACECCGLSVEPFALALSIHHTNYNGKEHRQLLGLHSMSVTQWVLTTDNPRAEPFPVEVLCQVCHQLTHQMGRCPHRWRSLQPTAAAGSQ